MASDRLPTVLALEVALSRRSQTWKTFLHNHVAGIGAMDFLIVPTRRSPGTRSRST